MIISKKTGTILVLFVILAFGTLWAKPEQDTKASAEETKAQQSTELPQSQEKHKEPNAPQENDLVAEESQTTGSDPCEATAIDPNMLAEMKTTLHDEQNSTELPSWQKPVKYWHRQYHKQATRRVFMLISYPYYTGGEDYVRDYKGLFESQFQSDFSESTADPCKPPKADDSGETAAETADKAKTGGKAKTGDKDETNAKIDSGNNPEDAPSMPQADPNMILPTTDPNTVIVDLVKRLTALQKCCDMIHKWRDINESTGTVQEILYAIELTKTATKIYDRSPELAVDVYRTIGQLGQLNRRFDRISRMACKSILEGLPSNVLTSRMKKQLADIETLLDKLAERNDLVSRAIGANKLDHGPINPRLSDRIDFTNFAMPVTY